MTSNSHFQTSEFLKNTNSSLLDAKSQNFFFPFNTNNSNISLAPSRATTDTASTVSPQTSLEAPLDNESDFADDLSHIREEKTQNVKNSNPENSDLDHPSTPNNFEDLISSESDEDKELLASKGWKPSDDQTLLGLAGKYKCDWKKIAKKFDNKKFTPYFLKIRYKELIDAPVQKKHKFTEAEDLLLAKLYKTIGSDWNAISKHFKNRTGVMLKNRYYSYIRKRGLLDELVSKAEGKPACEEPREEAQEVQHIVEEPQQPQETFLEKCEMPRIYDFESLFSETVYEFEGILPCDELQDRVTPMTFESYTCGVSYSAQTANANKFGNPNPSYRMVQCSNYRNC